MPGSSPRAWGAPRPCARRGLGPGDHPHERGEHRLGRLRPLRGRGSSPRAWGAPARFHGHTQLEGIIPTSVGSTLSSADLSGSKKDHPHERGEHKNSNPGSPDHWGSSPRAWGALPDVQRYAVCSGIIPTSVGSTTSPAMCPRPTRDHPHERGEHATAPEADVAQPGSSPRAWGARDVLRQRDVAGGIIPTSVGSTDMRSSSARC